MKTTAEVLIVGGGAVGNATAYYLAKSGVDVLVLEGSDSIGHGGSSRNGGGVRQSGRDPRELPFAMYGIQHLWPTLSEELGVDVEYHQGGNLRLGKTDRHIKILQGLAERAKNVGLGVEMVDGHTVKELCPFLADDIIGASWCPTDGHANPMRTTLAFYKRARELGARYISGERVVSIRKIRGKARAVVTANGNTYEAETIVLASGFGSRSVAASVGLDLPMTSGYIEALVTEMQPKMFDIMLGTADADFYGHQCDHGSFVFGSGSGLEDFADRNETTGDLRTTSLTVSAGCRAVMAYVPALREAKIIRSWGGYCDTTPDHVPIISFVEEVPGLILSCGFCGHGFGTSPAIGFLVSQMARGEETYAPIDALRYDRFRSVI